VRICLICTEKLPVPPVRGGAIQVYIDGILPVLAHRHQVTVVGRSDPDLPDFEECGSICHVRVTGGERSPYYANVAAYLAAAQPFDRVVVYNRPAYLPLLADAAHGAPMWLSMHNDMFGSDRLEPAAARAVLEQVQGVVTISDYVRRTINGLFPGYGAKLVTVRSGVDVAGFRPVFAVGAEERRELRAGLGLPPDDPVVLHVSRLSVKKGNDLVVQAMADVRRTHPDALLCVVGSSRYGSDDLDLFGQSVVRQARTLLGDRVRFTGFVPPSRLPAVFPAGDLFICASQWEEPLARVHYEAMAAGLPIITTDRGGNLEVAEEGQNSLVARPHHDPAAFAAQIRRLLDDVALREQMGRRGRQLAEEQYTWARVGEELLNVLEGG